MPIPVHASLLSDIGCKRSANQDFGVIVQPNGPSGKGLLIAVADGMGGHKGGEVASRTAIESISRIYYESDGDIQTCLRTAFEQANAQVYHQSFESEDWNGMGTTCTALVLTDGSAYSAHVGDSRMYLIRSGEIYLTTEDHSAVMEMVKQGVLTVEEARHHAQKNVITRAIGTRPDVEVYTWPEPFPTQPGDTFVLCSDGLYDRIEDMEIRDIASSHSPTEACEVMIEMAKQRGGYDNITVAVVSLGGTAA